MSSRLNVTNTFVELEVSRAAFQEIEHKLLKAGYEHAFIMDQNTGKQTIDMHGIALVEEKSKGIDYEWIPRDKVGKVEIGDIEFPQGVYRLKRKRITSGSES